MYPRNLSYRKITKIVWYFQLPLSSLQNSGHWPLVTGFYPLASGVRFNGYELRVACFAGQTEMIDL